jgi:hypothetical protein
MRILAIALLALVTITTVAHAEETTPVVVTTPLPINRGDWEVGGGASFTRNVRTNRRFLSISPKAEYFFVNRFSAGGTVEYTDDNIRGTTYGIGPSATYYITHTDALAVSLNQAVVWTKPYAGDNYVMGATGLAVDYFVAPTIAFGPELRGVYYFNGGLDKPDDEVQLRFAFSLFL